MDSVTQFVLGAAVGELVLKPEPAEGELSADECLTRDRFTFGAFFLGGLFGTLPDLDVLFRPWLNGPQALGFHRGVTHSFFFCTLVTPLLAWLLSRAFQSKELSIGRWVCFVWLALNTHWMIDSLTTYGTQVFLPFSDYPVNGSSIFIIDFFYTFPLCAGCALSLWRSRGGRVGGSSAIKFALLISTAYLGLTLLSKYTVLARFRSSLQAQNIEYRQLISTPTFFNSILWYAYADDGENVWVANSSLFDEPEREISWQKIPKNRELYPHFGDGPAGTRLLWFSRGFYRLQTAVVDSEERPLFIDLRFGRMGTWLVQRSPQGDDYVFRFGLKPRSLAGPYQDFDRLRPGGSLDDIPWDIFWRRLLGRFG